MAQRFLSEGGVELKLILSDSYQGQTTNQEMTFLINIWYALVAILNSIEYQYVLTPVTDDRQSNSGAIYLVKSTT